MSQDTDWLGHTYRVSIKKILDEGWIYALQLDPIVARRYYDDSPRTVLTIRLADQSELLGLLNRIHDMGLSLLSVERSPFDHAENRM